jgi:predicted tellurium resistance membrane protein TerC
MLTLFALIAAFVVPVLSPTVAALIMSTAVGWAGQFLKAHKAFPTPLAHAALFAIGFGLYAMVKHPTSTDAEWFSNAVAWALAGSGVSSIAGSTGLAPKTDSL